MSSDWRKLVVFLGALAGLYIAIVATVADFSQVLSLKYGLRLLALLLVVVVVYAGCQLGLRFWRHYQTLRAKLREASDCILRSGERSTIILLCAQARWLFQHQGRSIRVSKVEFQESESILKLDVSQAYLRPSDNLLGMHFAIIGFDGGERAKGTVRQCDSAQASVELYEQTNLPCVGDWAIPIEPPEATDLERLLGEILFIVSR